MEISELISGSYAIASPCGKYIASVSTAKLRICATHAPERYTDVNIRPVKDITSLKWSQDSNRLAILSAQQIEVVCLDDADHRVRLDNGSGGLGRFAAIDFLTSEQLLVVWEFGKAKVWNLADGKGVELTDLKVSCASPTWQMRPGDGNPNTRILATLSRPGSDDMLNIYFPTLHKQLSSTKLSTIDAQLLSWSPDGRWLVVLDSPTAPVSVHVFTPGGHLFRTYPASAETDTTSLGIKSALWSADSQTLALTRHDSRVMLLNTRTFAPLAIVEHSTTIDQRSLPPDQQSPIWQESVSASGERTYARAAPPVSPPLSRTKPSVEPSELGVAEARFNCNGSYLATRDERMLNTVWIWNMSTLAAHTVLIQHSNVRQLAWHPTRAELLMLDCGEGTAYLFDVSSAEPPVPISTSMTAKPALWWTKLCSSSKTVFVAASKTSFRVVYPQGQLDADDLIHERKTVDDGFNEGASEDSLFDVLSGRTPLHPKTEPSYTERIDMEVETEEEDATARVDDTFMGKKKSRRPVPVDPFDDSEIF